MATDRPRLNPFRVVEMFEEELSAYTGAPYVVTVDSCTNALFLALLYRRQDPAWVFKSSGHSLNSITVPKHTYVGVGQAIRNAGFIPVWTDNVWEEYGHYRLRPADIVDSAKSFYRNMYMKDTLTCVSFQASKILPIGRGGAILTDNKEAADWLRRARFDGRTAGDSCDTLTEVQRPGFHMYLTPPDAARGLWLLYYLPDDPLDQVDEYPDLSLMDWS